MTQTDGDSSDKQHTKLEH